MSLFKRGDRVRVEQPFMGDEEFSWHGKVGVVVREPGEPATPGFEGLGPSTSYAVKFDDSPYPSAPFRDETMDPRYHALIVREED